MGQLVKYRVVDGVATIVIDDGKVNVMSLAMQNAIHGALDRAEADGAVVVLAGRPGVFSAGFDLVTLRAGGDAAVDMVWGGFELAARVLAFPHPVVVACTGHAVAMGAFLLLSGDLRIGCDGPFRITANEVAIGLTMPRAAIEILRQRLTPAAFNRAVTLADTFTPTDALAAGFFDRLVDVDEAVAAAQVIGVQLATLDQGAHAASKLRARQATLEGIRVGLDRDRAELVTQ
jgi:enoyl-CoA hydratase